MPVAGAFSCPARYLAPKAPADRASDHAKGGAGHCALRPHFLGLCRNDFCRPELAMCAGITPAARASFAPLRRGFSFWNDSPRRQRGAIPAASTWRTPPSQPRASPRSRASACGLRGSRRPASTAMAGLPARPWLRPMPRVLAARASALAAWRSTARSPRGRHPSTARRRVLRGRTHGSAPRSSRRS